ncbi:MAG: hypothetical protein PHQ75_02240 [Thermoguttaceae bacterium]|nr:hypothetical protein [Thermoguttaceae bacterium]
MMRTFARMSLNLGAFALLIAYSCFMIALSFMTTGGFALFACFLLYNLIAFVYVFAKKASCEQCFMGAIVAFWFLLILFVLFVLSFVNDDETGVILADFLFFIAIDICNLIVFIVFWGMLFLADYMGGNSEGYSEENEIDHMV